MYYTNAGKLMKEVSYSDYYSEFIVNGDSIYCYKVGLKDVDLYFNLLPILWIF